MYILATIYSEDENAHGMMEENKKRKQHRSKIQDPRWKRPRNGNDYGVDVVAGNQEKYRKYGEE